MRLLVTRAMPASVAARAAEAFEATIRDSHEPLTEVELRDALRDHDVVMPTLRDAFSREVFADVPEPRARMLANFGVGTDHIDIVAARAAGLEVTNTPGAVTDATADIAMTLLLGTARRAGEGERLVRAGRWKGWHPTQLLGSHVSGKRLGVLGMGRIGEAVARRAHFGFGMSVGYVARSEKSPGFPARRLPDAVALAAESDFLVVAVPGGAETRHLVGADVLQAMSAHGILVNVSRGDVVDEAALVSALESGEIAGAGLDVYEFEPNVPESLRAMERVTLLPHLGTATLEVREAMGHMALDNAEAFRDGRELPNPVG